MWETGEPQHHEEQKMIWNVFWHIFTCQYKRHHFSDFRPKMCMWHSQPHASSNSILQTPCTVIIACTLISASHHHGNSCHPNSHLPHTFKKPSKEAVAIYSHFEQTKDSLKKKHQQSTSPNLRGRESICFYGAVWRSLTKLCSTGYRCNLKQNSQLGKHDNKPTFKTSSKKMSCTDVKRNLIPGFEGSHCICSNVFSQRTGNKISLLFTNITNKHIKIEFTEWRHGRWEFPKPILLIRCDSLRNHLKVERTLTIHFLTNFFFTSYVLGRFFNLFKGFSPFKKMLPEVFFYIFILILIVYSHYPLLNRLFVTVPLRLMHANEL